MELLNTRQTLGEQWSAKKRLLDEGRWAWKGLLWDSQWSVVKLGTRGAGLMGRNGMGWRMVGSRMEAENSRAPVGWKRGVGHGWGRSRLWRPAVLVGVMRAHSLAEVRRGRG